MMSLKEITNTKNPDIEALSAPKTHEKVLALLTKETPGKVLDIGAGPGAMSYALSQRGFDVRACDVHPEHFKVKHIQCDKVDLNQELSIYDSESFDFATCCEVLEHVENHFLLVREIARILKPKGRVIFSTPNIAHIQSRIFFLFSQHFPGFKDGDFSEGHIHPVYLTFFIKILTQAGFRPPRITYNRGWIYTSQGKGTLNVGDIPGRKNGFEIPLNNRLFGQIAIIDTEKLR